MPTNTGATTIPNWDSCTTVSMLENEFINWARTICYEQFIVDKKISITNGVIQNSQVERLYTQEYKINPKKFYVVDSKAWYFGSNTSLRNNLKQQYNILKSKKTNMKWTSFIEDTNDIKTSVSGTYNYDKSARNELLQIAADYKIGKISVQEKIDRIDIFNQKYGTAILNSSTVSQLEKEAKKTVNGIVNDLNTEINKAKTQLEGTYVLSEAARSELQKIATQYKNGELTDAEKQAAVTQFNKTYGTNVSVKSTAKNLESAANKKSGILSTTGNDIATIFKSKIQELTNLSQYWDNSSNDIIQKFTKAGITGDVMWGIITGKYNKDDSCRQDLERLSALVSQGKGSSEEAITLRNKINTKYSLNLDDSITAEDIAKVVSSNQKYNYKKTVRKIAEGIIQEKLNEQIRKQIEEKIGCKLEDWGIEFKDNDIIGTIRNIIRGNTTAFFNEEKFLRKLQKELETKIDSFINEKVNKIIDSQATKISQGIDNVAQKVISTIDPYRQKLDNAVNKLESWLSNPESSKLMIAEKLDDLIKSPVDAIASKLNSVDGMLQKVGLGNLGLGNMFTEITQNFTKGMADKIYSITKPAVEKVLGIAKTVQTALTKLVDTVNKLKEKAKQLVEQWKEKIKQVIDEAAKKLVDELTKYVKINFAGSIGSGFKL